MSTPDPFINILRMMAAQIVPHGPPIAGTLPANSAAPPTVLEAGGRQAIRRHNPQAVMARRGIMPQMASPDTALARRIYDAIYPSAYGDGQWSPEDNEAVAAGRSPSGQSRTVRVARALAGMDNPPRTQAPPPREDAWRLYLGLPQQHDTFAVSSFKPSRATDSESLYFSIPSFLDHVREIGLAGADSGGSSGSRNRGASVVNKAREQSDADVVRQLVSQAQNSGGKILAEDNATGVMGNFTIGLGRDSRGPYVSYYDKWDLDPTGAMARSMLSKAGRAFEIYDRIYYNPETFQPIATPREDRVGNRTRDPSNERKQVNP